VHIGSAAKIEFEVYWISCEKMLHAIIKHNEQTRTRPDTRREQVGSLAVMTHPSARSHLNYAWPMVADGSKATVHIDRADIMEVIRYFREANRRPRFEFPAQIAPMLGLLLDQHGFTETRRMPLMAWLWPTSLTAPRGFTLRTLQTPDDLHTHLAISDAGFDHEPPDNVDERFAPLWQDHLDQRRLFLTGHLGDEPVATAQVIVGSSSAEIINVTTIPAHRRKGVAAALTLEAVQRARASGAELIFLSSATDEATRVYRRIGFQEIGLFTHWVLNS